MHSSLVIVCSSGFSELISEPLGLAGVDFKWTIASQMERNTGRGAL